MLPKPWLRLALILAGGATQIVRADVESRVLSRAEIAVLTDSATSPIVKEALDLKRTVDKANFWDLDLLLARTASDDRMVFTDEMFTEACAKIDGDYQKLIEFKTALSRVTFDPVKYIPLTSSLGKLLGNPTRTGILRDAIDLLNGPHAAKLHQSIFDWEPANNEITVVKTALLYLRQAALKLDHLPFEKLQLNYHAEIPIGVVLDENPTSWITKSDSGNYLNVPNAGFVLGGNFVAGAKPECTGIDCSSYISRVEHSQLRVSTWVLEVAAKISRHEPLAAADAAVRNEFYAQWGLGETLADFSTVKHPEPGDIILWNYQAAGETKSTRYAVIYAAPSESAGDKFIAVEFNRLDDKSIEGPVVRELSLNRANGKTYILRKRLSDF